MVSILNRDGPELPTDKPGKRIVLIDDNREAADSLAYLLRCMGHEVAVAYSGPDGVRTAARLRAEAVLVDVWLPGLDGWAVARQLRQHAATADALLVAITAHRDEGLREQARRAGFNRLVLKPADLDELIEVMVHGRAEKAAAATAGG